MSEKSSFLFDIGRQISSSNLFAILFSFMLSALGCLGGEDSPSGSLERRSAPESIRVGTSGDYAPFSVWSREDAAPTGFSADVARAFAESEGVDIEWVRFRWPELLGDLAADRFDLALSGITLRPERSLAGLFSVPLTTSGAVVLVPASSEIGGRARSALDLDAARLSLAVNAGGHLERVARDRFPHAQIEAVPDNDAVLGRLASGRVDGVVTDDIEAPHWQARLPGLQRIGPFTRDRKAALFQPDRTMLARRFDTWLLDAEAEGRLDRHRRRHGLPAARTALPETALLASLAERLALMPSVAEAKRILDRPVEDRAREEKVLSAAEQSVSEAADATGRGRPDPIVVRRLFRAQIEAAKWVQTRALEKPASEYGNPSTPEQARRELEEALRPALIRIGDRIARLVVAIGDDPRPAIDRAAVDRALAGYDLPESLGGEIAAALQQLRRGAGDPGSALPPRPEAPDRSPNE
jgi:cyclohexadienyl dehydratase